MSIRQTMALAAAAMITTVAGVGLSSTAAHASTRLGGVNVEGVCQFDYGYHAYVASWSAYGWKCNPVPGNAYYKILDRDADMNKACRLQYGTGAWATFSDVNNPYSWSCYR